MSLVISSNALQSTSMKNTSFWLATVHKLLFPNLKGSNNNKNNLKAGLWVFVIFLPWKQRLRFLNSGVQFPPCFLPCLLFF